MAVPRFINYQNDEGNTVPGILVQEASDAEGASNAIVMPLEGTIEVAPDAIKELA